MTTIRMTLAERRQVPCYYEATKYPEIFSDSYWGGHRGEVKNTIINNRNYFVEKYNISGYKSIRSTTQKMAKKTFIFHDEKYKKIAPPKHIHKACFIWNAGMKRDHVEHYTIKGTKGKSFIEVFSQHKYEYLHDVILEHGYIEVPPLYAEDQITYIKIIHPDTL